MTFSSYLPSKKSRKRKFFSYKLLGGRRNMLFKEAKLAILNAPKKEKAKPFVVAAGIFVATISLANMQPIQAKAAESTLTSNQQAIVCDVPEIELEKKLFFKDNKEHDALTNETRKTLYTWVCNIEIDGEKVFPNITPELIEAQQGKESTFVVDATNGVNGTGSCVGLSQSNCKFNIDNVNKWCFVVGEKPIETKEEARELLLKHPILNTLVECQQLQDYYNRCPEKYAENPTKYALTIYRWGNINDGQVEYNGENNYADEIIENAKGLEKEYELWENSNCSEIRSESDVSNRLNKIFGESTMTAYNQNKAVLPSAIQDAISKTEYQLMPEIADNLEDDMEF